MKKFKTLLLLAFYILWSISLNINPQITSGVNTPWTREKAEHLARATLFNVDSSLIDTLTNAGSASAAVNIIFPSMEGPDRTRYNDAIQTYITKGFNWENQMQLSRLYQFQYALDPYEAKKKLFSLFEDIYSVNHTDQVGFKDIYEQQILLENLMFGNYEVLVKRLLNNNGNPGDFAESMFLNLLNQNDPRSPNANYARELIQLFMMGDYQPPKSTLSPDTKNYTEGDVTALSYILTGLEADMITHKVSFNPKQHASGIVSFLTGVVSPGYNTPFYNSSSGTIDLNRILEPQNGNNGLTDNIVEYIFAKRSPQIALFLADRIYRFYINDIPTKAELDVIASIILSNNFEMFPSIKSILALDMMYTDRSMHSVRYKNPLELYIGTIKQFRNNSFTGMLLDVNLQDTNILPGLNWTPYFPGSVFGRDGFDDSAKWNSTSIQNVWMTITNNFAFRSSPDAPLDFRLPLGNFRKQLTNEIIPVFTHSENSYSGSMNALSIDLQIESSKLVTQSSNNIQAEAMNVGELASVPDQIQEVPQSNTENFSLPQSVSSLKQEQGAISFESSFVESPHYTYVITSLVDTPMISDSGSGDPGFESVFQSAPEENPTDSGVVSVDSLDLGMNDSSGETGESTHIQIAKTGALFPVSTVALDTPPNNISQSESVDPSIALSTKPFATSSSSISINNGQVNFPNFQITTNSGTIIIFSGSYNASMKTLSIFSGSLMNGKTGSLITGGTVTFSSASYLVADVLSADQVYTVYEKYILGERTLTSDVRNKITDFLRFDSSGIPQPIAPSNTKFYNTSILGLISILLSQPEYVLLRGWSSATAIDQSNQNFLDNQTSKIIFIELNGGNDYLSSIIPKDEYEYYKAIRTNNSGSIALSGSDLVDLGDYYMNRALAYGSGGSSGFKDFYDQGYLKLFNRVGFKNHSSNHNYAALQMASYDDIIKGSGDGIFGHLIKNDLNSLNTISLGSRQPQVFNAGRYVNMGGGIIISNNYSPSYTRHIDLLNTMMRTRSYPGNTENMFKNAVIISDTAKVSVSQGGPAGASGDMNSVFRFLKLLMANNVGKSFYLAGQGGYDTHENQFNALNTNLQTVSRAVSTFFNAVKDTQDVTIVISSEFGRSNGMNGDFGTDHGAAGGIYVLSSNTNLRNNLKTGTYGNLGIQASGERLRVGIDYRSVYAKIYESLYGIDGPKYFEDSTVGLEKDITQEKSKISLMSKTYYLPYFRDDVNVSIGFKIKYVNYDPEKASTRSYFTAGTGTDANSYGFYPDESLISTGNYLLSANFSSQNSPYYKFHSISNQYVPTEFSADLTGDNLPLIIRAPDNRISQTRSSFLIQFALIPAKVFSGSGLILNNTGALYIPLPSRGFGIQFSSGLTNGTELTSVESGSIWQGGFLLGDRIAIDTFWPENAVLTTENLTLPRENILRINKLGPDALGLGMNINQPINLSFTDIADSKNYRVITSDDGVNWKDVESSGKKYQRNATNSITFTTKHLTYFALLSDTATAVIPSCTMSFSPTAVTNSSGSTLTWSLQNTLTGILTPGNIILGISGSRTIIPPSDATTVYTLSVVNPIGTNTCQASVSASTVITPAPVPTLIFSASSTTLPYNGTSTLNWSSTNTTSCTTPWGSTATGGTFTTAPLTSNTTYTVSCVGPGGTTTKTVIITVGAQPPVTGGGGGGVITGPGGGGGGGSSSLPTSSQIPMPVPAQKISEPTVSLSSIDSFLPGIKNRSSALVRNPRVKQQMVILAMYYWKQSLTSTDTLYSSKLMQGIDSKIEASNSLGERTALREIQKYFQILSGTREPSSTPKVPDTIGTVANIESSSSQNSMSGTDTDTNMYKYVSAPRFLYLRKDPFILDSNIITELQRNERVQVLDTKEGWSQVVYNDSTGYVKDSYIRSPLLTDAIREGQVPDTLARRGFINAVQSAYVRLSADITSQITSVIYSGQEVNLLDEVSGWVEITWGKNLHGFIRHELITIRN